MGIADYGIGPGGPYQYATNASLGQIDMVSLQTRNATGDPMMTFQLNVNLVFTSGGAQYAYWVQDVVVINTSANELFFLDNVWNFSAFRGSMTSSGISGNGQVALSNGTGYYYDIGNAYYIHFTDPTLVQLEVVSAMNSAHQPSVTFSYDTGGGFRSYDTVTFVAANAVNAMPGFEVNGFNYNPDGLFFDSELIMGGPGGGSQTADVQSNVRLGLYYFNGHNFQSVQNAYNFGSDTAEGASNVLSQPSHYLATGGLIAELQAGSGSLSTLYSQTQISTIDVKTSVSSGTLYLSNATYAGATPEQVPFVNGEVIVSLAPGEYLLQLYQSGSLYDQGTETVAAGQTLQLQSPLGDIQVTMSYVVQGGGSGFAPTLTYTHGGVLVTAALSTSPATYFMDPGTSWQVSGNQTGANERWVTLQTTSGTATSYQTIQLTFYHQVMATFAYDIANAGGSPSPPSLPSIQIVQYGRSLTVVAGSAAWVDVGTSYAFTSPLSGSTSTERWSTVQGSGTVSSATTVRATYYPQFTAKVSDSFVGGSSPTVPTLNGNQFGSTLSLGLAQGQSAWLDSGANWSVTNPIQAGASERWISSSNMSGTVVGPIDSSFTYYHQFALTMSFSVSGGGNPSAPMFQSVQLGLGTSIPLSTTPNSYFLDAGSNWTLPSLLGGGSPNERWITTQPDSGTVAAASTVAITYGHQFMVITSFGPDAGGSITNSSGWYDSGASVQLSATAKSGWKFEGWTGSGVGAYTGLLNQTSVQAVGAFSERAVFYPGLTMASGDNGGLTYSYGDKTGTIASGTPQTIYAPQGSVISLRAVPSSLLYAFNGWNPASTGTSGQTSFTLDSPAAIQASFSLNLVVILGIVGAVAAIALVSVLALKTRSKNAKSGP